MDSLHKGSVIWSSDNFLCWCLEQATWDLNRVNEVRHILADTCATNNSNQNNHSIVLKTVLLSVVLTTHDFMLPSINSLWPSDAIWWHRSESTLPQLMACCLTAPSNYLNKCWLIIAKVLWHSFDNRFSTYAQPSITEIRFEIGYLKFYSDLPGANELNHIQQDSYQSWWWQSGIRICQSILTRGQFWPLGIVVACVCLSMCPCVPSHPFQVDLPNLS